MSGPILNLSGERFTVTYRLSGDEAEARAKAQAICIEQTVEFPQELLPVGGIRDHIVGRVESFQALNMAGPYEAAISYAVETIGFELVQLLNVIFGNTSIKPGVRVEGLGLPAGLLAAFQGPRFGLAGLRARLHAAERPLLCTALKPMGLSAQALADLTYQLALGGIDIIKDDHGLADQTFSPFRERANRQTGLSCVYAPYVSAPAHRILENASFARSAGAGAVMVSPGLVGLDTMRLLADDDQTALPILSHPAFLGSFVTSPASGISHGALFGQIARLAGADATIFPNYGGRFAFSRDECRGIAAACAAPLGHIKPIFPAPGGGMSLEQVPDMLDVYGTTCSS